MANVLILEDDIIYRKCLYITIKKLGHSPVLFIKPSDAIKQNMIIYADLIISDYEMEDETILELLCYLRKNNISKTLLVNSGYAMAKQIIIDNNYAELVTEYTDKYITKEILNKYL